MPEGRFPCYALVRITPKGVSKCAHIRSANWDSNKSAHPFSGFKAGSENETVHIRILCKEGQNNRAIVSLIPLDQLHQFRIKRLRCPRNIRAMFSDPFFDPVHTHIKGIIQKNDRITGSKPRLIRSAVISVKDSSVRQQDLIQLPVKFLSGNMRSVRFPPNIVQVKQRQARNVPKLP